MIKPCKAKLRAWLIELVREAVRIECAEWKMIPPKFQDGTLAKLPEAPKQQVVAVEPSFEDIQAMAIKEQEKYYERIT